MPGFQNLQERILFFFLGLFILVYVLAFLAVNTVVTQSAHAQLKSELLAGGRVFDRLIKVRTERLVLAARRRQAHAAFRDAQSRGPHTGGRHAARFP